MYVLYTVYTLGDPGPMMLAKRGSRVAGHSPRSSAAAAATVVFYEPESIDNVVFIIIIILFILYVCMYIIRLHSSVKLYHKSFIHSNLCF